MGGKNEEGKGGNGDIWSFWGGGGALHGKGVPIVQTTDLWFFGKELSIIHSAWRSKGGRVPSRRGTQGIHKCRKSSKDSRGDEGVSLKEGENKRDVVHLFEGRCYFLFVFILQESRAHYPRKEGMQNQDQSEG